MDSATRVSGAPASADLHKLAAGSALAFTGTVLGNALAYLFGLIMGRFVGTEAVGLYFIALAVMQVTGALARAGLADGLLRFVAIHVGEGNRSRVKGTIAFAIAVAAATSVVASALLFVFSTFLSTEVLKQPDLVVYVRWIAAALPFFTLLTILLNGTQALKRMDLVVVSRDFVQPFTMIAGALVLFYFNRHPASFLAAHFWSMVLGCVAAAYLLRRAAPDLAPSTAASFEDWKVLTAFSLPIAGGDLIHYLYRWSDTFLLSYFRSSSEVGVYSAASRTTLLLGLLAAAVTALYAPLVAEHHHNGRRDRIEQMLTTLVRWCLTLALPIVLTMCLLARPILSLWGPHFESGAAVLIILSLSQLLLIVSTLLAFTLLMCGRQYLEVANVLIVTVINVVASIILTPRYGTTGAATAMLASQLAILVIRLTETRHLLGLRIYTPRYLKPFAALVPAAFLGLWLREFLAQTAIAFGGSPVPGMVLMVASITLGYFVVLYAIGFEEEDVTVWRQVRASSPL